MKLLISPKNFDEAITVIKNKVDILDIKNPDEGSLGGQYPWIIEKITSIIPEGMETSAAVCDSIDKPGLITQALYGLFQFNLDYIKVGIYEPREKSKIINLIQKITKAKKEYGYKGNLVIAGYADWLRANSINPLELPKIVGDQDISVIMIDTFIKDNKGLFDFIKLNELKKFIEECHKKRFKTALAGKIQLRDIPKLKEINCDIVGIRSLACENQDRLNGAITSEKIKEIKKYF
ncbi:MAG: (5-formylfuran-3-yl)methyl phosphate synthase [Candidatus Odinarchaeia archaeon]